MQDLPYLNTRFRDFKGNWRGVGGGRGCFGIESMHGMRHPDYNRNVWVGMRGLKHPIEDPVRSCLQGGRVSLVLGLPKQEGDPSTRTFLLFFYATCLQGRSGYSGARVTLIEC